jgi:hypothetical protein
MLDVRGGRIAYAVLSSGGFLGMGHTLYAIPWSALTLDTGEKCFRLDIAAERIKNAPGFDKDHWPALSDCTSTTTSGPTGWPPAAQSKAGRSNFKSLKPGTNLSVVVKPTGRLRHLFETPVARPAFSCH